MTMARSVIYRATGAVSLAGVAIWILGMVALVALYTARVIGPMPPPIITMSAPVAWVFFIIGLSGLYVWLGKRVGALVWLPGVVAIVAVALLLVAEVYTAYTSQVGVQYMGSATVVSLAQRSQLNEQLQYNAYVASNLSYPVLGLALVVTGLLTLRAPALQTVARTLLLMGVVGMLYYFFTDIGAPSLLRNTGTPGLLGMVAGALVFYGVGLFGCCGWGAGSGRQARSGRRRRQRRRPESPAHHRLRLILRSTDEQTEARRETPQGCSAASLYSVNAREIARDCAKLRRFSRVGGESVLGESVLREPSGC